jgi:hypothetical protein
LRTSLKVTLKLSSQCYCKMWIQCYKVFVSFRVIFIKWLFFLFSYL